jgi:predicted transcriptional regulator
MISAKATSEADQSDAVVVSFDAKWHPLLTKTGITAVIRKRIPKTITPHWLYFHINAPIGTICARAQITAIAEIPLPQAKALSTSLALKLDEIQTYFEGAVTIGCYRIGAIQPVSRPVTLSDIRKHMAYFPPQSFMILSKQAKSIIDRIAGFTTKTGS